MRSRPDTGSTRPEFPAAANPREELTGQDLERPAPKGNGQRRHAANLLLPVPAPNRLRAVFRARGIGGFEKSMRRCLTALPPSIHSCHPGRPEGEPGTRADPKGLCRWLWSPDRRFAPSGVTGKGFRQLRSAYSSVRSSITLPIRDNYKMLTIFSSHHKILLTNFPVADMETAHRCTDADRPWHNKPGCTPVRSGFVLLGICLLMLCKKIARYLIFFLISYVPSIGN